MNELDITKLEQITGLIEKHRAGLLTPDETTALEAWKREHPGNQLVFEQLLDDNHLANELLGMEKVSSQQRVQSIFKKAGIYRPKRSIYYRVAVAASILVLLTAGGLFYMHNNKTKPIPVIADARKTDPDAHGALLTLTNGRTLFLDSVKDGVIASQGEVDVVKKNGRIFYLDKKNGEPVAGSNTISTPRGRIFQVLLPDNSKVWLNAESNITYPVSFTGNERKVIINGEAYFEVARNKEKPFRVELPNHTTIEVLGTHFNVNAYSNGNSVNTTLFEGRVQLSTLSSRDKHVILAPGQQAQQVKDNEIKVVSNVDLYPIISWKDEMFMFQNTGLEKIMQEITRWYNVEVVYKDRIPDNYTVSVSKKLPLLQLLKSIENSGGVHFEIRNKEIIVTK